MVQWVGDLLGRHKDLRSGTLHPGMAAWPSLPKGQACSTVRDCVLKHKERETEDMGCSVLVSACTQTACIHTLMWMFYMHTTHRGRHIHIHKHTHRHRYTHTIQTLVVLFITSRIQATAVSYLLDYEFSVSSNTFQNIPNLHIRLHSNCATRGGS